MAEESTVYSRDRASNTGALKAAEESERMK